MKKWESKKQLRKRIAQLEGALSVTGPSVHIVEKDITNVCYSVDIEDRVPAEFIKEDIARRLDDMYAKEDATYAAMLKELREL